MTKTSKILKIIGRTVEVLYIVAILAFSCLAIFSSNKGTGAEVSSTPINHYTLLTVKSDSMKGEFDKNSLVLAQVPNEKEILSLRAREVDPETNEVIYEGDIISFKAMISGQVAINTHRIIAVHNAESIETIRFSTKGDNSNSVDSSLVTGAEVLAVYKLSIPKVGGWIMSLKEGYTFIYFVIIPLIILLVYNAFIFIKNITDMRAEKIALEKGAELTDEEKEAIRQEYLKSLMEQEKPKKDEE